MERWLAVMMACVVFMIVGCSSGDDDPPPPESKTLTAESGDEIVILAQDAGCEDVTNLRAYVADGKKIDKVQSLLMDLYLKLKPQEGMIYKQEIHEDSDTIIGSCGGDLTFTFTWDDVTNRETITIAANNYCDGDDLDKIELNGNGSLTCTPDGNVDQVIITSPGLHLIITEEGETIFDVNLVVDATITSTYNGDDEEVTATLNKFELTDYIEGETLTITGYATTSYDSTENTTEVEFSGTSTDSEGVVNITTTEPIITNDDDGIAVSGTVVITGANGTSVRITIIRANTFLVEVDTNGDGSYDYDAGCVECDTPVMPIPV